MLWTPSLDLEEPITAAICGFATQAKLSASAAGCGRRGGLIFVDLRDRTGLVQPSFLETQPTDRGFLRRRPVCARNMWSPPLAWSASGESKSQKIATGDIEIEVTQSAASGQVRDAAL